MNRAWFGAWGADLEPERFAAALAALGVVGGASGVYASAAVEAAWKSSTMRWRLPADIGDHDPQQLARAWLARRGDWRERNLSGFPPDPWAEAVPMPRLAVEWSEPDDPEWVISRLSSDAVGPLSVYVPDPGAGEAARWEWPLEIGLLGDADAQAAPRSVTDRSRTVDFARVQRADMGGSYDILLLAAPLRAAASAVLTGEIRAGCVLCLHTPAGRWSVTRPLMNAVRAHVDAAAIALSPVAPACRTAWLESMVAALANGHPLDVAVRRAAHGARAAPPSLFVSEHFLEETRLARTAQRRRERRAPVQRAAAPPRGFDQGRGVADVAVELAKDGEDLPPPPARFIQARMLDAEGEALTAPLTPGEPHVVEVRVAEPARGWTSARGAPFPAPEGAIAHRLTVVLFAPDVLSEPLVEEIVLPARGPSSTCAFVLLARPELTRLRARIAVLHGNRLLQTAKLDVPVGGDGDHSLELTAEPEAMLRLGLEDLDWRRPSEAAVLVDHDGEGNPDVAAISGARARLLLPADFREATKLLYRVLERAVLEPDGYDALDDETSARLLAALANHGHRLYEVFMESEGAPFVADADRLQLVVLRDGADFPLEFVYDRAAPELKASLCANALAGLQEGRCAGCSPPGDRSVVCPMAFWGLKKSIEREPCPGTAETYIPEVREATRKRSSLTPPSGVLFATSEKVRADDVERLRETLSSSLPAVPLEADDWAQWRARVAADHPPLLVLLPHNEPEPYSGLPALEIGGDGTLVYTNVSDEVICPGNSHRPVVLLLGCSTAVSEVSLYDFPPKFHQEGAAIVIGTVTKVLGRHAAPAAGIIVAELAARAKTQNAYITDVIRDVRRRLLAEGRPLGLALVAYGDGDWTVGGS